MSVPTNSPHADFAKAFTKFIVGKPAQQFSLDNMGGVIRSDVDTSNVTPGLRPFLAPDAPRQVSDNAVTTFPWFIKLQAAYYKMLMAAITNPPGDWDAWMKDTATKRRAELETLKKG